MLWDNLLDEESILDRVDAYSIYSFYIGDELEIGRAYSSPLHNDNVPSFAMFSFNGLLFFKDHALGESGLVFKFVMLLFGYTIPNDALSKINVDFDLGLSGGNPSITREGEVAVRSGPAKTKDKLKAIKILSKEALSQEFIDYWFKNYGITEKTLRYYNSSEPEVVQYIYSKNTLVSYPKELTVAYRINTEYKLYTPFASDKRLKFLNNFPINYIEGYLQLKYIKDFLIITKAMKEVMFFREHFDWDACAGKSENTIIKRHMMLKLVQKYKYIFIFLDNDIAGQRAQLAYLKEYPFLIPIFYDHVEKDPTDAFDKSLDREATLKEIKQLVYDTRRGV